MTQLENIASIYVTDTIFILGKGKSSDCINADAFSNALVIAINDAERIAKADITVFHADWVKVSLEESGFNSNLYVTSTDFSPTDREVFHAQHIHLSQESSDLIMQRFMGDDFVIEDILFLSALKIARLISQLKNRVQTVYMVGFDFDVNLGYSKKIINDYSTGYADEKSIRVSIQEHYFINALYFLRNSLLDVKHVGNRSFSLITTEELNATLCHLDSNIEAHYSTAVVAELTTNHFGDRLRLARMIRSAKIAGADYIKLQKRDVASFYSNEQLLSPYISPFGKTFADYRYQLELSKDDFEFVDKLCREINIGWFASILDEISFKFMQELSPTLVKLPSTISEHTDYLKYVANNYTGSVVLSTGMTNQAYEDFVLSTFTKCEKLYLLQCNSAYPTPLEDCNIAVVRHYSDLAKQNSRIIPGYSSHDFGWKASSLAVAAGAKMLEKHVKLGDTEWAHFDAVAVDLTTPDFKNYVSQIRETELMMGSSIKTVNQSEHHKYGKIS